MHTSSGSMTRIHINHMYAMRGHRIFVCISIYLYYTYYLIQNHQCGFTIPSNGTPSYRTVNSHPLSHSTTIAIRLFHQFLAQLILRSVSLPAASATFTHPPLQIWARLVYMLQLTIPTATNTSNGKNAEALWICYTVKYLWALASQKWFDCEQWMWVYAINDDGSTSHLCFRNDKRDGLHDSHETETNLYFRWHLENRKKEKEKRLKWR